MDPVVRAIFEVADMMRDALPEEDWWVHQAVAPPEDLDREDEEAVLLWLEKCNELNEGVTTLMRPTLEEAGTAIEGKELVAGPFLRTVDDVTCYYAYVRES